MSRRTRLLWWLAGSAAIVCVGVALIAIAVVRSAWFSDRVRERIVSEVERSTGGRAEIGTFRFDWHSLTAEVAPFVLHGNEPASAPPLFRAASIRVGLKVVSLLKRDVDIQSLTADQPEVRIVVNPDGSTNVPQPRMRRRSGGLVEQVLSLAVRRVALNNGFVEYNSRRWPLQIQAERLRLDIVYDARGPRYRGNISISPLHFSAGPAHDLTFNAAASLAIDKQGLRVVRGLVTMPNSNLAFNGDLLNWAAPVGDFDVGVHVAVPDVSRPLGIEHLFARGEVDFKGRLHFSEQELRLSGLSAGRDVDLRTPAFHLSGGSFSARTEITESGLELTGLSVAALGGRFEGRLNLRNWRTFLADGEVRSVSMRDLMHAQTRSAVAWDGTITGPVRATGEIGANGLRDVMAEAAVDVAPAATGPGIAGRLDVNYDQRAGTIRLGQSQLNTGNSRVTLEGTLGESLSVGVETRNIDDLLPLFSLAGTEPPQNVPVRLTNGASGHLTATVQGPLADPTIAGHVDLGQFECENQIFGHSTADFQLTRSRLDVRDLSIRHEQMQLSGAGHVDLNAWRAQDTSSLSGSFLLRDGDLARLVAEAGKNWPITGSVSGTLNVEGTWGRPIVNVSGRATNVTAWQEHIATASLDLRYADDAVEIRNVNADAAGGHLQFSGRWRDGRLEFHVAGGRLNLERIAHLQDLGGKASGEASVNLTGTVRVGKDRIEPEALRGSLAVSNAGVNGVPVGSLTVTAETSGSTLRVKADGNLREAPVHADGEWKLDGNYPGHAQLTLAPVSLAALDGIYTGARGEPPRDLPFVGTVSGSATMTGPLADPDQLRGEVHLDQIRIAPNPDVQARAGAAPPEIALQNAGPVVFDVSKNGADIRDARFSATDSELAARGRIGFGAQNPWDVSVTGSINLRILRLFNSDLLASGHADARATIRGSFDNPQLNGRLELQNASLYLADLPNGVSNANGVLVFDRNRATIQRLTAESGGGRVSFSGFVGFAGPVLSYRVAARAEGVRYRSPQGTSITMDATLDLTGTSEASLASGSVTVVRAAFNPGADIGSLLAQAAKPVPTPTPSDYFRGLRFDIHVETAQRLEIQTSLARNLQGHADLRITGTPQRPVVLGNISVNEGSIEFFGNRYSISRGEVNFYNPLKIEPVVDLDLETHERGVTVDIILTGPLDRLSLSYRSDPPLKSEQIVALLTVGRSPNAPGALASTQTTGQTALLESGSNALLQQALTAPATGRLERFFGVSHIRLDPQLTDITTVPQARLSVEQQISKDVTLIYTTNLARTQEQLVQIEWDLSRKWSVVAVRDENGFFGIDFQYRKRFK
jgi:translocation and assembly module TamB